MKNITIVMILLISLVKLASSISKKQLFDFKFYKPAQKQKSLFGKDKFKLRFPEMQKCIVFQNFFAQISAFFDLKFNFKKLNYPQNDQILAKQLPIVVPNFQNKENKLKITWIGHSTTVLSFANKLNIIIDPVFSQKDKRYQKPACQIKDLFNIDIVLVSHDHYDHLDTFSLQEIEKMFHPYFIAGLDSKDIFPKNSKIIELDWTQSFQYSIKENQSEKPYKITFVPSAHWSQRGLLDKNQRLWGGFVIQTPNNKKIYYSGDTGYCSIFKELGQFFQSFDVSLLPIGAYKPRKYMEPQHIDPFSAVRIHKQIKSKKSIGIHWGTYSYGNQYITEPRQTLKSAKLFYNLEQSQFITLKHGESIVIDL